MKKFIFTLCAIAFSSLLVQAQDTPSLDDATITVKKVEKKTKASYTDYYNADDNMKKVVVKKATYSGSTNTVNTNSKKRTLTEAANSQKYKVTDKNPALSNKTKAAEKNKSVTAKETKNKNKAKLKGNNDDENNNE